MNKINEAWKLYTENYSVYFDDNILDNNILGEYFYIDGYNKPFRRDPVYDKIIVTPIPTNYDMNLIERDIYKLKNFIIRNYRDCTNTDLKTPAPTTSAPTPAPTTSAPTPAPTTPAPTTPAPTTPAPTTPQLTYKYHMGEWSECSENCGGGTQNRTVECKSSVGQVVDDTFCTDDKPLSNQACNLRDCETYKYVVSDWSRCSNDCGGGTQTRTVECQSSSGNSVAGSLCTGTAPVTSQDCNIQPCKCSEDIDENEKCPTDDKIFNVDNGNVHTFPHIGKVKFSRENIADCEIPDKWKSTVWVNDNPYESLNQNGYSYYCPGIRYQANPDKRESDENLKNRCPSPDVIDGIPGSSNIECVNSKETIFGKPEYSDEFSNKLNDLEKRLNGDSVLVRNSGSPINYECPGTLCSDIRKCEVNLEEVEKENKAKINYDSNEFDKYTYWNYSPLRSALVNKLQDSKTNTIEPYIREYIMNPNSFPSDVCLQENSKTYTEHINHKDCFMNYWKHSNKEGWMIYNQIYGGIGKNILEIHKNDSDGTLFMNREIDENFSNTLTKFFNPNPNEPVEIKYIDIPDKKYVVLTSSIGENCKECDKTMDYGTILPYLMCVCSPGGIDKLRNNLKDAKKSNDEINDDEIARQVKLAEDHCRCGRRFLTSGDIKDPEIDECEPWLGRHDEEGNPVEYSGVSINAKSYDWTEHFEKLGTQS
jgi:hypothetical protein